MILRVLPLLIIVGLFSLLDYTIIRSFNRSFDIGFYYLGPQVIYAVIAILGYLALSILIFSNGRLSYPRTRMNNYLIGFAFALFSCKLIYVMLYSLGSIIIYGGNSFDIWSNSAWEFWVTFCVGVIVFIFLSMIYGMTRGKYNFQVVPISIPFPHLPLAFDGLRIAHISDIHSGTWDSVEKVAQGIKMIQDEKPDLILFTGDLVNQYKDEIDPYMDTFAQLTAPLGKYAVLGNHDYVGRPRDPHQRKAYWDDFLGKFQYMGFDLILNDNRLIKKENESIRLVGVENWGTGRFFPKKGDLDKAYRNVGMDEFNILMSHDPSHWDEKVLKFPRQVDLTLSGHTHGMQFGWDYKWLRWSPVRYRYKRWIGLHKVDHQRLYINRGFGMLAFPGRVGMWPEITMITLRKTD